MTEQRESTVPDGWPPVMDVTGIDAAGNLFRLRVSAPSGAVSVAMSADLLKAAGISRYSAVTGAPRGEASLPDASSAVTVRAGGTP